MSFEALVGPWADRPILSVLVWLPVLMGLAYAARPWSHRLIRRATRALGLLLRHAARSTQRARLRLRRWYLRYLRGVEMRRLEGRLDRAYQGIHLRVNRDLGGFPALERRILRQIETLEQDYHSARDQVPEEPAWVRTANALAAAPPKADPRVGQILEEIHDSMARAGREAMEEYRRASQSRLETLKGLLPAWRALGDRLQQLEHAVRGLSEQTRHLDAMVGRYRRLRRGATPARTLTLASAGLLAVTAAVMALQGLSAGVLFFLVEPPMAQVLGDGTPGAGADLGPWAVGALILAVVLGGAMVTEARQVSHLIPGFSAMDPRGRSRTVALGLVLVGLSVLLCGLLAATREVHALQTDPLGLLLEAEPEPLESVEDWFSTFTRLFLGILLPLPLALVALPLQVFLQSVAVVVGGLAVMVMALVATLLSWMALAAYLSGAMLRALYEFFIFIPLLLERAWGRWRRRRDAPGGRDAPAALLSRSEVSPSGDGSGWGRP
ncbi:MAG: hypothetical protein ACLFTM_00630 [Ectothiorhodospira sp.]